MHLPPFKLERYFARYEFAVRRIPHQCKQVTSDTRIVLRGNVKNGRGSNRCIDSITARRQIT